ncbi:uncharacterized protein [Procambarus clarkii]|uniref:uncharacterized protein n=1 Tax=Procambarus clarkii TaxID=6728 RepID=UPI0037441E00
MPPPNHHKFLGPYRPACTITPWVSSAVMCFNCQHFGHVAKHCKSSVACALCAANHLTKECPNKDHALGTDETSSSATKHKCSRCLREGVTAWHKDCVKRPPPHSTVGQPSTTPVNPPTRGGPTTTPTRPPTRDDPTTVPDANSLTTFPRLPGKPDASLHREVLELPARMSKIEITVNKLQETLTKIENGLNSIYAKINMDDLGQCSSDHLASPRSEENVQV